MNDTLVRVTTRAIEQHTRNIPYFFTVFCAMYQRTLLPLAILVFCSPHVRAESSATTQALRSIYSWRAEPFDKGKRPDDLLSFDSLKLLGEDTGYVVTSPLRWTSRDWLDGGIAVSLVLASSHFDARVRHEAQEEHHVGDNLTRSFQQFGATYSFLILGAFEGYGLAADSSKSKAVAFDGVAASVIASGVITPALKYSVGRVRPNRTEGTFQFRPFSGNYSFPSGHTTQAFAVASVIAAHYDAWWIQTIAYGIASSVGYSRIQQNQHFASDVVAGALIGYTVGRTVVRHNNAAPVTGFQLVPWSSGRSLGVQLTKCF